MSIKINKNENVSSKREILPTENSFIKLIMEFFEEITLITKFTFRFFKEVIKPPYEVNEFVKQSYLIGYKSFPLVAEQLKAFHLCISIIQDPFL